MCLNPCKFVCWVFSFIILFLMGLLFYVTVMDGHIVVMGVRSGDEFVAQNGRALTIALFFPFVWWSAAVCIRLVLWEIVRYPAVTIGSAIASVFSSSSSSGSGYEHYV